MTEFSGWRLGLNYLWQRLIVGGYARARLLAPQAFVKALHKGVAYCWGLNTPGYPYVFPLA